MESCSTAEQFLQQPQSILSDTDFVVIPDANASSPESVPSPPQESEPNSADYQLSLACQRSTELSEIKKMAEQVSQVKEKHFSMHGGLQESNNSLEQIRDVMTRKLGEMKATLADMQEKNREMKAELTRLQTREEEWQQTSQDYQKLKNEYGLLTNTKERLESERADLQRSRDEAVAAETEKLRARLDEERSAAVEAERAKYQQELMNLQAGHALDIDTLKLQLTDARKEAEANLQTAQNEKEQSLAAEQARCRAEAERLLAEHTSAMETMRKQFEEKALKQQKLLEEAKRELEESNSKYEAEKKEMLDMLGQFNVSSFATADCGSVDATASTDTEATLEEIRTVRSVHNRLAVQEQGASSAVPAPESSACFSVATSDAAVGTSVEMTRAAIDAAQQAEVGQPTRPDDNQTATAGGEVIRTTAETQTDPMECPQVENAESLQKNSQTRNLMMQLASFAQALATERKKNEDLEKSLVQQQRESADLLNQLAKCKPTASSQRSEEVSKLQKQLADKQIELDSLLKDFDETRHKVYELNEAVKDFKNRAECRAQKANGQAASDGEQASHLAADGDTGRLQKLLFDKQSELDSVLEDFDETRHKVYELSERIKDYESRAQVRNQSSVNRTREVSSPAPSRGSQYTDEQIGKLRKQLAEKQDELDSLLKDFDETRHKIYEQNEKIKDLESRSIQSDSATEKLRQTIKDLESQAEIDKNLANQLQMEIESLIKGEQFKAAKLQAAENEAEKLRQEIQRLTKEMEQLRKELRVTDETVRQILTDSDNIKREHDELSAKCQAREEALDDNRKRFEEKANLELKLRETIGELMDRLKRQVDESDQKAKEEKRKFEQLYNKLCKEADENKKTHVLLDQTKQQLQQTQRELEQVRQQLNQAKQQLQRMQQQFNETNAKLQESEKFSADLQSYSSDIETKLEETVNKRDSIIQMCEQLRHRFEAEQHRSANAESELQKLKLEHSRLQAEYTAAAQSATAWLAREHDLQTHLCQLEEKLGQAEEVIVMCKDELMVKENDLEKLKGRLNLLLEDVASQEPQHGASGSDFLNKHRTLPRSSGGGNY